MFAEPVDVLRARLAGRGLRVADAADVVVVVAALRTVLAAADLATTDFVVAVFEPATFATAFFADLTAVLADEAPETVLPAVLTFDAALAFGAVLALDTVVVRLRLAGLEAPSTADR